MILWQWCWWGRWLPEPKHLDLRQLHGSLERQDRRITHWCADLEHHLGKKLEQQVDPESRTRNRKWWYKEVKDTEENTCHSKICTQRKRMSWIKKTQHTRYKLGRLNWIGLGIIRTPGKETVQESQRTEENCHPDREAAVVICGWWTHPCLLLKLLCH